MRGDALQRDLPAPDEACARHRCLYERVEAPDLAMMKIFFRFYIATSSGRIMAKPTVQLTPILNGFLLALLVSLLGTQLTANCEAKLAKKVQYSNPLIRIAVY